jgi:hypothetical protein
MYCKNCGAQNKDDAQFCRNCGKAISIAPHEASVVNIAKKATLGQKIGAFLIGWVGAGILWAIGTSVATSAHISSGSGLGVIGELVGITLVIWVWIKLYQYYINKWVKK